MEPQLHQGDRVMIDTLAYDLRLAPPGGGVTPLRDARLHSIGRGDIVAFTHAAGEGRELFLKRVVGLPGEVVRLAHGAVLIDATRSSGAPVPSRSTGPSVVRLGRDAYYMLGDNRPESDDSRTFGPVSRSAIVGRARFVVWPLRDVKSIR